MPDARPQFSRTDEDFRIADLIIGLFYEAERYGMLGIFPASELDRWLQRRVVAFVRARQVGGVPDDAPIVTLSEKPQLRPPRRRRSRNYG